MLRAGLAFSQCDIAVITNVTADHLGLSDVHTLDELAKVKGLVVDAVKPGGWAVLNAENEYTYHIGQQSKTKSLISVWIKIILHLPNTSAKAKRLLCRRRFD
ncbi:MAG: hypothetical protein IPO72_12625 [Saprospiraceae bacterium]|nr:hypothetical protein [Candidatus Vicinibacter affinis]